jgi:hypothetical protein
MGNMWVEARLDCKRSDHDMLVWWSYEVGCMLDSLSAVLDLAQDLAVRCQESMPTFGASLRSEGRRFAHWSESHPCPDLHLSYLLGKVGPSCRALADLVDMESNNPHGPDWMFIDVRLNGLRHLLAKAAAELAGEPDPAEGPAGHRAEDRAQAVEPRHRSGSRAIPLGSMGGRQFPWEVDCQLSDTPGSWLAAKAEPS